MLRTWDVPVFPPMRAPSTLIALPAAVPPGFVTSSNPASTYFIFCSLRFNFAKFGFLSDIISRGFTTRFDTTRASIVANCKQFTKINPWPIPEITVSPLTHWVPVFFSFHFLSGIIPGISRAKISPMYFSVNPSFNAMRFIASIPILSAS